MDRVPIKKWRSCQRCPDRRLVEADTLTMPEMVKELGVPRGTVYSILKAEKNRDKLEVIEIGGKKRITKESFESWYAGQDRYIKVSDRPAEEQREIDWKKKVKKKPRLIVDPDKSSYSVPETAVLLDITVKEVYEQIRLGNLEAASFGNKFRIRRDDIHWWLVQHKKELESEE